MNSPETPLVGPPPAEVPLENAPLVRVLAQVRFPLVASLSNADFIASFQEAIRRDYPILRPEHIRGVVMDPKGPISTRSTSIWRFQDTEKTWRASLAPDFLALETTQYVSRDDFLQRFEQVLIALRDLIDPQVLDRLGVRYIDRIVGDDLQDISALVRPEVAGIMASPLAEHALHAISEHMFALPEQSGKLLARWGQVPAGGTVDPAAVDAIDAPSWLLDVDAFIEDSSPFDVDAVLRRARDFAERIYAFFRWAVTEDFLRRYGGEQ